MAMNENMIRSGAFEEEQGNTSGSYHYDNLIHPAFNSLVAEIMALFAAPSSKRHELERLLSRYMKQEGNFASPEPMLIPCWNLDNQISMPGTRVLQLQFLKNVCQLVSTGDPIKGEDGHSLEVALIDCQSRKVVTFGPEASTRVEIVVIDADLGGALGENMTREEFKSKIVKEGNKRLLNGNVVLDLKEGKGFVGIVRFSHTKIWKTKCTYRLGAIVTDDIIATKIREGFTEPFIVKDHRLDLNKKHYPPSLSDEVWRLDGISKDGAFHQRLRNAGVNTVEDLLKKHIKDPLKLRDILGGMSGKKCEALVAHARTCKGLHLYFSSGSPQKTGVLFNVVGQVMGLISEVDYFGFEMLSEPQKGHAENLVASAYEEWDKVVPFKDEASFKEFVGPSNIVNHLEPPIIECSNAINILIPRIDGFDTLQSATSFDDTPSLFDESPTMERSISGKNIISSNLDEQYFSQPAVLSSLSFESPRPSNIICPPKSPIQESSHDSQIVGSLNKDELGFPPPVSLFHGDFTLSKESPGPSNNTFPSKSIINESGTGSKILIPPEIDELDSPKPVVSLDNFSISELFEMGHEHDQYWQSVDRESNMHESDFICSNQTEDPDWEFIPMLQRSCEENHDFPVQFSVGEEPLESQGTIMESPVNPQSENGPLLTCTTVALGNNARKRYLQNKAKMKWRVLSVVMRWLFECRNAAGDDMLLEQSFDAAGNITQRKYMLKREKARRMWAKLYSVMRWFSVRRNVKKRGAFTLTMRDPSCSSSLNALSDIWAINSSSYNGYTRSLHVSPNQQNSTNFTISDHEDEFIHLFYTVCSLQARNRNSKDRLARWRNAAEISFAKKRWRMLFSIMKWFSVRRTAVKIKAPNNNCQ